MKIVLILLTFLITLVGLSQPALAVSAQDVTNFSSQALQFLTGVALLASTFFIIRGGYMYITSAGNLESLDRAKRLIKNSLLGLVVVLSAAIISSVLAQSYHQINPSSFVNQAPLSDVSAAKPQEGLTQVILDAITGFLREAVGSATKPLIDGVMGFLTTTPLVSNNSVIFNFWLIILGITDSLFVVFTALMGLHLMSAETFGFEEVPLQNLLPRIGLAFLGANTSIFLIDWLILSANSLTGTVLSLTGGIEKAWLFSAFNPSSLLISAPLMTLIFLAVFVILTSLLLLFYISRIIIVTVGAVLSPLIFLLWTIPKLSSIAEILVKGYLVSIFVVFVQVVIIQLASAVLTSPSLASSSSLLSILIGIGLLLTLLKTPPLLIQVAMQSSTTSAYKKMGSQIVNVMSNRGSVDKSPPITPTQAARKAFK